MDRNADQLGWTDEQWSKVSKAIAEEGNRARVAASFLPTDVLDPTTSSTTDAVPIYRQAPQNIPTPPGAAPAAPAGQRLGVNTDPVLLLGRYALPAYLRARDVADPDLVSALGMFRRMANVLARTEDALIFNGQPARDQNPLSAPAQLAAWGGTTHGGGTLDPTVILPGPYPAGVLPTAAEGLLPLYGVARPRGGPGGWLLQQGQRQAVFLLDHTPNLGTRLVSGVANAMAQLEAVGYPRPFVCVLSTYLYQIACTPLGRNLVLPRDRIASMLDGRIYCSSVIPENLNQQRAYGVVVSLAANPIELVVANDLAVDYLQVNAEPRFLLRISERIALRIKDYASIAVLYTGPNAANPDS